MLKLVLMHQYHMYKMTDVSSINEAALEASLVNLGIIGLLKASDAEEAL